MLLAYFTRDMEQPERVARGSILSVDPAQMAWLKELDSEAVLDVTPRTDAVAVSGAFDGGWVRFTPHSTVALVMCTCMQDGGRGWHPKNPLLSCPACLGARRVVEHGISLSVAAVYRAWYAACIRWVALGGRPAERPPEPATAFG